MKKGFVFFIALFCGFSFSLFAKENTNNNASLFFQENKGQVTDQNHLLRNDILFYGTTQDLGFFVKKNGVSYQLYKAADTSKTSPSVTIQRVDISWTGANENATIIKENPAASVNNYYNVEVPALNVKSYEQFRFQDLYNGIDLKYYQQNGSLKYDYIIHPNADYHQIQLHVEGAELSLGKDGAVTLKTPLGNITEGQPIAYQNGQPVAVKWVLSNNTLSFQISDYNPNEELVIDPLVFVGIFIGKIQNGPNYGWFLSIKGCINDKDGNTFKYGKLSDSWGYLVKYKPNDSIAFIDTIVGSSSSAYIGVNINSGGIDSEGNIYLAGYTNSNAFIATSGAYQTTFMGYQDGFIFKLNNGNGHKIWGTYFGGYSNDSINGCAVTKQGSIFISGSTRSSNLISTAGSLQTVSGGDSDGFIAKFNSDGQRVWSTYYGGTGADYCNKIVFDSSNNNLFVGGNTKSNTSIATAGSFSSSYNSANQVGFLVRFDTLGNRIWGTYFGKDSLSIEYVTGNNNGSLFLVGNTRDTAGIAFGNANQGINKGLQDGYLTKFNENGFPIWGTYIGGNQWDEVKTCSLDKKGHVFVSGSTYSNDPALVTPTAIQSSFLNQGVYSLIQEYDTSGNKTWGSFCCGNLISAPNYSVYCYANDSGNVELSGYYTAGVANNYYYLYFAKFTQYHVPFPFIAGNTLKLCDNDSMQLTTTSVSFANYEWYLNQNLLPFSNSNVYYAKTPGVYSVKVSSLGSTATSQPFNVVSDPPFFASFSSTNVSCGGLQDGTLSVVVSGGTPPYLYSYNGTVFDTNKIFMQAGNYLVVAVDSAGCRKSDSIKITQPPIINLSADISNQLCYPFPVGAVNVYVFGGIPPYHYAWNNLPDTTSSITHLYTGFYTVTLTDSINCKAIMTFEVQKDSSPMPTNPLVSICAVTVDSFENKNRIVWEKGGNSHASAYNIYREGTVAEQYDLIGTQASDKYTAYLDSNANPLQQSYRYKITETDSCGNEFSKSAYHQTIHLSASSGINGEVNLSWNLYEGVGFNTQYIKRSINGNAFVSIAQVASTTTSYTDANPPAGQKDYRIDIDLPIGCVYNSFHQITSNAITFNPNGSTVHIFPNPTADLLNIRGTIPSKILLEDLAGKKVVEEGKTNELSIHYLATGMYLIKLFDNNGNCYFRSKIVKH